MPVSSRACVLNPRFTYFPFSVTYLRCPLTYFPFRWPTFRFRWPNNPLTYFRWPTYGARWPTFRFRWPTYGTRWPTSGDLLSVTTCQGDHGHYFLAMTSLWPHIAHTPLSSRTQPFFLIHIFKKHFFMAVQRACSVVHCSSKGLFYGSFLDCLFLFCFNFFNFLN